MRQDKGCCLEMKQIVEDFQMQALGGLAAAWDLWEQALILSLLAGAGTWLGDASIHHLCNKTQDFYWTTLLKVPDSCPKSAIICKTFMKSMKWRIWEQKCFLVLRVKNLEEGSLAKNTKEHIIYPVFH